MSTKKENLKEKAADAIHNVLGKAADVADNLADKAKCAAGKCDKSK